MSKGLYLLGLGLWFGPNLPHFQEIFKKKAQKMPKLQVQLQGIEQRGTYLNTLRV